MKQILVHVAALTLAVAPAALADRPKGDPGAAAKIQQMLEAPGGGGDDIGQQMHGVATAMADIAGDLDHQQTDAPVQTKQKAVTGSLDTMIAALDKACNGGGGGTMNPTKGLKKSILAGGPGGEGDLHDARAGEKQWGTLKPKEREQILQSKTDGFPAGYESMLQSYYRRLSAEDNTPAAPPAPEPARR